MTNDDWLGVWTKAHDQRWADYWWQKLVEGDHL